MTSLDGINGPVDSDVTEGVITTRSNRMKFRLYIQYNHVGALENHTKSNNITKLLTELKKATEVMERTNVTKRFC